MENKAHALAAGTFVVLVAALLVTLAVWLTRDSAVRDTYELATRETISGLQPQAPVRYRGIAVGKVTFIGFDPAQIGQVLVRLAVDDAAPITRSTYATLAYQGVTGLAYVLLEDDGSAPERLPTSDAKPARIPLRASLITKLSDQGTVIVSRLETTVSRLNDLLSAEHQRTLMQSVQQAGEAARQVGELSASLARVADAQFGPQQTNVPQLIRELEATLKVVREVGAQAGQTAQAATVAAGEFAQTARTLNAPGGTLERLGQGAEALAASGRTLNEQTLPRVGRVADDAARSARSAQRTLSTLGEQPQSLIWGLGPVPPGPGEPGFVAPTPAR